MNVVSYLDCGCAILSDGGREWCPTCAAKIEGTYKEAQPLDDKELREKLRKAICGSIYGDSDCPTDDCAVCGNRRTYLNLDNVVDPVLALLQPKIEEARRQGEDRIKSMIAEEARRIRKGVKSHYPMCEPIRKNDDGRETAYGFIKRFLQALKE